MSTPQRLVLTEAQSEHIRQSGARFLVVHPASYPAPHAGRWVIDLIPCDHSTATAACNVALGTHRALAKPQTRRA